MTGCLESTKRWLLTVYNTLPAAAAIARFGEQQDVVDRIIKSGRLICYIAYAVSRATGAPLSLTCDIIRFGNLWRASRYVAMTALYGFITAPNLFLSIKKVFIFARAVLRGEGAIPTGLRVNNPLVQYSQRAVGAAEQGFVLFANSLMMVALAAFCYANYVASPLSYYKQFFVAKESASDAVKSICMMISPVLFTAFAALSANYIAKLCFNALAMRRFRSDGMATQEDEIQYRYDQKKLAVYFIFRVLETLEFFLMMQGFSSLPMNKTCHGIDQSNAYLPNITGATSAPSPFGPEVCWQDWLATCAGSVGVVLVFLKCWMDVNPPKFPDRPAPMIRV